MAKRGRPKEEHIPLIKYKVESSDYTGEQVTYHFNSKINPNGPYRVIIDNPCKEAINNKPQIQNTSYNNAPVVMVFKTSNRKNAKTKMKIWKNSNIDKVISSKTLVGVPDDAEILELAVGVGAIDKFKEKYQL